MTLPYTRIPCDGIKDPECIVRFFSYVGYPDENGCVPWKGTFNSKKSEHGRFAGGPWEPYRGYQRRKHVVASRFVWALYNGEPPADLHVLHNCDNAWCVNVFHLRLGDDQENNDDVHRRGLSKLGGEGHGAAKLTHRSVIEIYDLAWRSPYSGPEIGALYGISGSHVSSIKNGQSRSRTTGHKPSGRAAETPRGKSLTSAPETESL